MSEMSENTSKQWSTEEIIKHSDNWSLAGDVALLNTIKSFANNLLSKADILNDNVNNLLHGLDEVSLKLDICQNEFQNLKNTQFIESRVYDDDEALDSKDVDDETSIKPEDNESDISLTDEIKLLDEYYETVEISGSDSEDELEKSFVLKEKDIYEDRQLPPLIGSDEWHKNWYIKDEDDDLDSNESSEIYSGSCSDEDLPKDLFNGSQTSSELEFSNKINDNDLIANSTVKQESTISSEDSENANSSLPEAPVSNLTFAEQLAAKLDNVISREENINKKPIHKQIVDPFSAGLFADEPPPLNDTDEIISEQPIVKKQLFDDEDNNSLFRKNSLKPSEGIKGESNLKDDRDIMVKSSQLSKGLFDSESSDDDLFNPKIKIPSIKTTILQPNKPIVPLFDEEPPSLENSQKFDEQPKKKPAGAVSIFGEKDIGDIFSKPQLHDPNLIKPSIKKDSRKEETNLPKKELSTNLFDSNKNDVNKKISSLFDDNEDDEDDIFSNTKQTKNYSLFDDDDDDNVEYDYNKKKIDKKAISLFDSEDESSNNNISANDSKTKKISLFDHDDEDNLLFSDTTEKSDSKLLEEPEKTEYSSNSNNARGAIEKEFISDVINDNIDIDKKVIFETIPSQKTDTYDNSSKKISLFDDDEDEDDSLFSSVPKISDSYLPKPQEPQQLDDTITTTNPPVEEKQFVSDKISHADDGVEEIFAKNSTNEQEDSSSARPVIGLFDSSPPPDDGDWDTKSDQFSDTDDFVSYRRDENVNKLRLFDDDPPDDDEDSFDRIVTKTDTRMDKDISDTYANDASFDIFSDKADKIITESKSVDAMTTTPGGLSEGFSEKAISSDSDKTENPPSNPQLDINEKDVRKPNKIADITERLNRQKPAKPTAGLKPNSPGKLKQTLNINVNALLPGLSQPKIKHLTKTQAKDSDEIQTTTTSEPKVADADDGKSKIASKSEQEKLTGFDVPDNVEILPSITKERVKNPAKRRPSTRRARQQAIRKSFIENDDFDSPEEEPSIAAVEEKKSDLLEVKIPEIVENVETETVEINTNTDDSKKATKLFNSESESDTDDLFNVSKKIKPKLSNEKPEVVKKSDFEANTKVSLFDDKSDDDSSGLFEQLGNKEKEPMKSDKKKITTKKSLFAEGSSDEDDDDDLFSSKSDRKSASVFKPFEKINKPIIKKLENVETKDDPLSNLLN